MERKKLIEKINEKTKNLEFDGMLKNKYDDLIANGNLKTLHLLHKCIKETNNILFLFDIYSNIKYLYYSLIDDCIELDDLDNVQVLHINGTYYLLPNDEIENLDLFICDDCGKLEKIENQYYLDEYDKMICSDCYDDDYQTCEHCNGIFHVNDMERTADDYHLCNNCYDEHTGYCETCHERYYYYEDNIYYNEISDIYQCQDCYDDDENIANIERYHFSKDNNLYIFRKLENENIEKLITIGFELEIQNKGDKTHKYLIDESNLLDNDFIVSLENDSSVSNGFEIISHPFTYNYMLKNKNMLENTFKKLIENGAKSHYTSCCGLHFHIGNLSEQAKANIFYFFEKNYDLIYKYSRRTDKSYCDKNILNLKSKKRKKQIKQISKELNAYYSHSYALVNDDKTKTLEIRIFKGTLNFDTFLSNFLFIYSLCEIANRSNSKITFKRIVNNIKDENLKKLVKNKMMERGILICA